MPFHNFAISNINKRTLFLVKIYRFSLIILLHEKILASQAKWIEKTIRDWTIKCTRVVLVYYDHFIFIVKDIVSLGVVFVCKLVFVCAFVACAFGIGRIKKSYETSLRFCAIDAPKRKTGANTKWDKKNGPNARKRENRRTKCNSKGMINQRMRKEDGKKDRKWIA